MGAGEYRSRITILKPDVTTQNEAGEDVTNYVTYISVKAAAEFRSGKENEDGNKKLEIDADYIFKIRYLKGINIKEDMLISFNSRTFDIKAINNIDERNKELLIYAKEQVKPGEQR